MFGSRLLPLLLCWTAALGVSLTSGSDILEYYILEELAPRRVVGNIVNDFGFAERYDRDFGFLPWMLESRNHASVETERFGPISRVSNSICRPQFLSRPVSRPKFSSRSRRIGLV